MNTTQQEADIAGMMEAAQRHGALLPAEIVEQYRAIQARPITPPPGIHHAPQSVDVAKIAKGGGLLLAAAGVVAVFFVAIIAISGAVITFVETYATWIGGVVLTGFAAAITFSGSGKPEYKEQKSEGGNHYHYHYYQNNSFGGGAANQSTNQTNGTN